MLTILMLADIFMKSPDLPAKMLLLGIIIDSANIICTLLIYRQYIKSKQ